MLLSRRMTIVFSSAISPACCSIYLTDLLAAESEGESTCVTFAAPQFPLNPAASLLGNPGGVNSCFDTVLASRVRYKCLQKKKIYLGNRAAASTHTHTHPNGQMKGMKEKHLRPHRQVTVSAFLFFRNGAEIASRLSKS